MSKTAVARCLRQTGGAAEAKAGDGSRPQRKELNVGLLRLRVVWREKVVLVKGGLRGGLKEGTWGEPHHCGLT